MSFSNISIVGNLTRDPEMHVFTESKRKKTTMTVAVNIWNKGKDNRLEKTADFYKVETWDRLAELTKDYLSKGSQVAVSGRLQMESWLDKEGKNRVTPTVRANQIALPQKGKPPDASALSNSGAVAEAEAEMAGAVTEDDEFDPKELPPKSNGATSQADASGNESSEATDPDNDAENKPDDVEISENSDFSEGVSQPESVSQPQTPASQFGQTMKVVETVIQNPPTTIQNPPSVSSIARGA